MQIKRIDLQVADLKFSEKGRQFSGYASVFNGVDSYGDTIAPGAFENTLAERNRPVQMRWNHWGPVIGKWVELAEDDTGLFVTGELTVGHSVAEDAYALLKHGAIDGLSIGYFPVAVEDLEDDQRLLKEIDLVEISIVESPADLAAKIGSVKSAFDAAESLKEVEHLLRDLTGLSRSDALAIVSRIKSIMRGDRDMKNEAAEIAALFDQFKLPR